MKALQPTKDQHMNRTAIVGPASAFRAPSDGVAKRLRSRRSNDPTAGLSLITARGRRVADLTRAYLAAVGDPRDLGRQAEVIAAAEMQVLAEEARAAALRKPEKADLDAIVRIQGAADRALRRLGIKPSTGSHVPTLADYLSSKGRPTESTT